MVRPNWTAQVILNISNTLSGIGPTYEGEPEKSYLSRFDRYKKESQIAQAKSGSRRRERSSTNNESTKEVTNPVTSLAGPKHQTAANKRAMFKKTSSVASSFSGAENRWIQHECKAGEHKGQSFYHQPSTGITSWTRPSRKDVEITLATTSTTLIPNDEETDESTQASTTPPPLEPVIELHSFYSVLMFLLSLSQTFFYLHALYVDTEEDFEKFLGFWNLTMFPISFGAMAISFVLKVSRRVFHK